MTASRTIVPYFLYAAGILYREGLEALLVIIALAAGARGAGRAAGARAGRVADGARGAGRAAGVRGAGRAADARRGAGGAAGAGRSGGGRVRDVYAGAIAAVAASVLLAWAVNHVIGDDASDTLEGVFQIFAAATLFYVSSWLTAKKQSDRWRSFLSHQVEDVNHSAVPAIAFGLTAFLAVMREGAETIVFFQALTAGATEAAERHAVAAGIVVAALALAATFVILTRAAYRIPLGSFFSVTSILLYGLAVVFIGQGVASLQEAGVVSATFVDHVPTIVMLGLYPTVQSISAQLVLLCFAGLAIFMPRAASRRLKVSPSARAPETRPT